MTTTFNRWGFGPILQTYKGQKMKPYEIFNPSFRDIDLDQQIENGINQWCYEDKDGNPFYGDTAQGAIDSHNHHYGIK